jgi:mannan endo-1,4-beta-mannosidase
MKFSLGLASIAFALFANGANAANSWAGANNYYAYALPDSDRADLLNAMQAAGMKVCWIFT